MFQILIISFFIYLIILDFNYFLFLKKVIPLFPSNPPIKIEVMPSPLFLKIWLEIIYIYILFIYIYIYIYNRLYIYIFVALWYLPK